MAPSKGISHGSLIMNELKINFEINKNYAYLVGVAHIVYARFESTVVDIIGFYKKSYRANYYCKEMLNPSDIVKDLESITEIKDKEVLSSISKKFEQSTLLRNALSHSVPCGGSKDYDVLHFQTGLTPRNWKKPVINANPYRSKVFEYDYLSEEVQKMADSLREASKFFYQLRCRFDAGEPFEGDRN